MDIPSTRPKTRLADHVRACVVDDRMIFLDLRRNRYVGIGGDGLPALSAALLGTPASGDSLAHSCTHLPPDEWLRRLRHQNLVTTKPIAPSAQDHPRLDEPVASLDMEDVDGAIHAQWRDLICLWRATLVTSAWLYGRNLADIACHVAALRIPHAGSVADRGAATMHAAVVRYLRLRPFALSSRDRCLKDSLTLIHFLAACGLFPRWVIGVRARPFAAHSWVQSGSVVLNDQPEHVRGYQPILVV